MYVYIINDLIKVIKIIQSCVSFYEVVTLEEVMGSNLY